MKSLEILNDTLNLKIGVITYQFTKTPLLPENCHDPASVNAKDPLYNFEVFAATIKEHYAFFELNKINWPQLYKEQKEKLVLNNTDVNLYQIIEESFEKLNDNHGFIEASEEVYSEIETLESKRGEDSEDENDSVEYGDFQIAQMVAKHHLEEEMTDDSWLIQWGKLNNEIGYVQIKAMWLYADLEIPKELIEEIGYVDAYVSIFNKMCEGDYIDQEVKGVSKIMDKVMEDLASMESIVLDVRFNGGGQDAVSFEILSRFIPQNKLQVATQKLRYGNSFSKTTPLSIKGHDNAVFKPVYIISSPQTGSAAEAFSIASLAMDNAKRIGSQTSGAMSTALEKTLPNGWAFALSNEIYMDNKGICYENKGIPVDVELNYPKDRQTFFRKVANDLEKDKRQILEAVYHLERKSSFKNE